MYAPLVNYSLNIMFLFICSGEGEEPMTALDAERLAQGTKHTPLVFGLFLKINIKINVYLIFINNNFYISLTFQFLCSPRILKRTFYQAYQNYNFLFLT